MKTRRFLLRLIAIAAACAATVTALAGGQDSYGVWDTPGRYFPGKYFEQKAQFYLKKQDYVEALRMFELSGYWANKVSQYNAGIMYFNGIGVATNKPLGAAWLGLAAEGHNTLADAALQAAYAELSPEQRQQANDLFEQLEPKYGDEVTLPRALKRYSQDAKVSLFGFGVPGPGSVTTFTGGNHGYDENSASFVYRMDAQRDALIAEIRGHVSVGAVQPLNVPEQAKRDASHTPLPDQEPVERRE